MTDVPDDSLADQVREALRLVIDPELGYNIYDLGLIYEVEIKPRGAVRITMTTTTQGCPATSYLQQGARQAAASLPDVSVVEIELTYDPPWVPQMMSPDAMEHLGFTNGAA